MNQFTVASDYLPCTGDGYNIDTSATKPSYSMIDPHSNDTSILADTKRIRQFRLTQKKNKPFMIYQPSNNKRKRSITTTRQSSELTSTEPVSLVSEQHQRRRFDFIYPSVTLPFMIFLVLTRSSSAASSSGSIMPYRSTSAMRWSTPAWITTRNHKRLLPRSTSTGSSLHFESSRTTTTPYMITDSRELRIMETTTLSRRRRSIEQQLTSFGPLSSSFWSTPTAIAGSKSKTKSATSSMTSTRSANDSNRDSKSTSKSTVSVLEELIGNSYARAIENSTNSQIVSAIWSPLWNHNNNYNNQLLQEKEQQQQQHNDQNNYDTDDLISMVTATKSTACTTATDESELNSSNSAKSTTSHSLASPKKPIVSGGGDVWWYSSQSLASKTATMPCTTTASNQDRNRYFSTKPISSACLSSSVVMNNSAKSSSSHNKSSINNPMDKEDNRMFPKQQQKQQQQQRPLRTGYGSSIQLSQEERELFQLLRRVRKETHLQTTLRVAGGWVRDKLLATPEFSHHHHTIFFNDDSFSNNGGKSGSTTTTAATSKTSSSISSALTRMTTTGGNRLTSKFHRHRPAPSMGRQGTKIITTTTTNSCDDNERECQPVDIDIALDDMLGREFADHLNEYLEMKGEETVSVGVVLKNPEKSKHLETATMNINSFWIDFVNLRAEEYTQSDSRIPGMMRIGTADEDAYRRDLTINSLFYNINTGEIEDWTGRGFDDLKRSVIATPLPPLTTLLDDPLRVLRSIRFAARLRFTMDGELVKAARDERVAQALRQKVSRERVGGELDLMLRSPDPVGAVRLLINLNLVECVFPINQYLPNNGEYTPTLKQRNGMFQRGLELLSTTHDHLADCKWSPPVWCSKQQKLPKKSDDEPCTVSVDDSQLSSFVACGATEMRLLDDEESRRLLWYAAFITPLYNDYLKLQLRMSSGIESTNSRPCNRSRVNGCKRSKQSIISKLLVDELKLPNRDAEAVERIMKASDDFIQLVNAGCDVSATMILLSELRVAYVPEAKTFQCYMLGRLVDTCKEEHDPIWEHAMEFRLLCSKVLLRIGPLWRAALCLSIARELVRVRHNTIGSENINGDDDAIEYAIEGDIIDESQEECRQGVIERYDVFATALQHMGLIGIWNERPIADGDIVRTKCLKKIPPGPAFREVMDEQMNWMTTHPGNNIDALFEHLQATFPEYVDVADVPKHTKNTDNCSKKNKTKKKN